MAANITNAVRSAAALHRAEGRFPLLASSLLFTDTTRSTIRYSKKSIGWSTKETVSTATKASTFCPPSFHDAMNYAAFSHATSQCLDLRQPFLSSKAWMSTNSSNIPKTAGLENFRLLVTREAPDFTADAVLPNGELGKISLSNYRKENKGVVLLFYPLDFTFVCPSELLAFHHASSEFEKLNFQVLGISVDSVYTHLAWTRTSPDEGGIGSLSFPLLSDLNKEISNKFHILINTAGIALRGLFVIDKDGIIRHSTINDLPLGRNVEESLRVCEMIKELEKQKSQKNDKNVQQFVCPANWRRGEKMMRATFDGVKEYLSQKEKEIKKTVSGK